MATPPGGPRQGRLTRYLQPKLLPIRQVTKQLRHETDTNIMFVCRLHQGLPSPDSCI
jgi:hypothetical protein